MLSALTEQGVQGKLLAYCQDVLFPADEVNMIQVHERWKMSKKAEVKKPVIVTLSHKDSLTVTRFMDQIAEAVPGASNELRIRMWHFLIEKYPEVRDGGSWTINTNADCVYLEKEEK